jgi:hypothetical protein
MVAFETRERFEGGSVLDGTWTEMIDASSAPTVLARLVVDLFAVRLSRSW